MRPSETEDKGVNCTSLHIPLTSADISSDSLSLLYTGLPLKKFFKTVLSVMQNMDDPLKFAMPVSGQVLLVPKKLRLSLLFGDVANRYGIPGSHVCTIFNQRFETEEPISFASP